VKRPDRQQETELFELLHQDKLMNSDMPQTSEMPENSVNTKSHSNSDTLCKNRLLIGFLDPLDKETPHLEEYRLANLTALSLDNVDYAK